MTTTVTLNMYVLYISTFILGQAVAIFWYDIPQVRKLARINNDDFDWKRYWRTSWNMIIGLEFLGTIIFLTLNQIIQWRPGLLGQMWWMSPVFGMIGSGIGAQFGSYRKGILNILDRKTNIADGIIDPPKTTE